MNRFWSKGHKELLYLPDPGTMRGVTMQPQAMLLWPGMELLCCKRKYESNAAVTGAVYIVQSWDESNITVQLHSAYTPDGTAPPTHVVSHQKAADIFKLQLARVHANIQGRTCRTHFALTDLPNEHLTTCDLITTMSRPTHGRYLHFVEDDADVLTACAATDRDLERASRG